MGARDRIGEPGARAAPREARARVRASFIIFTKTALAILVVACAAFASGKPILLPPLGATAFICCFRPSAPAAAWKNIIVGHACGIGAGFAAVYLFRLDEAPGFHVDINVPRALAVALSLGLTSALMVLFDAIHPPAGATTLLISMGLLAGAGDGVYFMIGALALAALAAGLRAAGRRGGGLD